MRARSDAPPGTVPLPPLMAVVGSVRTRAETRGDRVFIPGVLRQAMRCVIVGYGRVGIRTADLLATEGHEVVVVENDPAKVESARESGFTVVEGDGSATAVLAEADLDAADAVGGLTGDPETNFAVCAVANDHGCRTVLRISEEFSAAVYREYSEGVDEIIYPEQLGAAGAKTALLGGDFSVLADITERLSAASLTVPEDSPVVGERVVALDVPDAARIYAHGRAGESLTIPLPRTAIEPGDRLALIADPDAVASVRATIHGTDASLSDDATKGEGRAAEAGTSGRASGEDGE